MKRMSPALRCGCIALVLILMIFSSCASGPVKTALTPDLAVIGKWTIDIVKTGNAPENPDADPDFTAGLEMMTDAIVTISADAISVFKQSDTDPLDEIMHYRVVSIAENSVTIVNTDNESEEVQATIVIIDENTIKWVEVDKYGMFVLYFTRI